MARTRVFTVSIATQTFIRAARVSTKKSVFPVDFVSSITGGSERLWSWSVVLSPARPPVCVCVLCPICDRSQVPAADLWNPVPVQDRKVQVLVQIFDQYARSINRWWCLQFSIPPTILYISSQSSRHQQKRTKLESHLRNLTFRWRFTYFRSHLPRHEDAALAPISMHDSPQGCCCIFSLDEHEVNVKWKCLERKVYWAFRRGEVQTALLQKFQQ